MTELQINVALVIVIFCGVLAIWKWKKYYFGKGNLK